MEHQRHLRASPLAARTDIERMTVAAVDPRRERLVQWLQAGRGYDFLTAATPYLYAQPDDHYIRLMAVREYLKLGLVLPARELVQADGLPYTLPADFDSVRLSIATLAATPIPWSRLDGRFEGNLAVWHRQLEKGPHSGPYADRTRDAWRRRRADFQLFRDARGHDQVRMRDAAGRWHWIPRLADHAAVDAATSLPAADKRPMPQPVVFEGLDLGGYFERVYQATLNTFLGYSCALFLVEPDPVMLGLVLHLRDWRHILADRRVFWFLGDGCTERLARVWDDDPDLPFPSHGFTLSRFRPGCSPSAVAVVQEATDRRERAIAESAADIERRYAGRVRAHWARRFDEALSGRGQPLRILAGVSTHTTFLQYSMRDAKRAFESLGHQCAVLTEGTPYDIVGPLSYQKAIRELDPDLFFNIDHLRPEFAGVLPANLPMLTWDQDQLPHVFTPANMRGIGPLDFVAGYSKIACVLAGCNARQFLFARVPTCPEQFSGPPLTDAERQRYGCDVSFVSHASQTPRAFHEEERSRVHDPKLKAMLDALFELTMEHLRKHHVMWGALPGILLEEAAQRVGLSPPEGELRSRLVGWYLWRLGDRLFRHEALEWVADWARRSGRSLRIYGTGWDRHPTLADFAAGPAENGRDLLCIYRASRINLQLMPAGFIHQRALDGLASGGFFLSRATPSDLRGRLLRKLDARIDALGLSTTRTLMDSDDTELRSLLSAYYGDWLSLVDKDSEEFLHAIRVPAEETYPDEVFPRFDEILFDSPESFAARADRFLASDSVRGEITDEMRRVVVERFSYAPIMDRFLRAMAGYLADTEGM